MIHSQCFDTSYLIGFVYRFGLMGLLRTLRQRYRLQWQEHDCSLTLTQIVLVLRHYPHERFEALRHT